MKFERGFQFMRLQKNKLLDFEHIINIEKYLCFLLDNITLSSRISFVIFNVKRSLGQNWIETKTTSYPLHSLSRSRMQQKIKTKDYFLQLDQTICNNKGMIFTLLIINHKIRMAKEVNNNVRLTTTNKAIN